MNLSEFEHQLSQAGVRGRLRARILAEFADHLDCDPDADLGDPAALARQFADELGTSLARQAAFRAFGALAVAGAAMFALFLWVGGFAGGFRTIPLDEPGLILPAAVFAQVALASGGLALLRAWRLRHSAAVPAAQALILRRRAGVGIVCGALTVFCFAGVADNVANVAALVLAGVSALALASALPPLIGSLAVRPVSAGSAGDLFDDLGVRPAWLTPGRVAVGLAVALCAGFTVAGIALDDGFDGALRGIFDGGACLVGYALLGGFLGLRAPRRPVAAG